MQLVCKLRGGNHTTTGCWISFNSIGVDLSWYWIFAYSYIFVYPHLLATQLVDTGQTDLDMDGV